MSHDPGRRGFLRTALGTAALALTGRPAAAVLRQDADRPSVADGLAVGDVVPGRAIVWSRTDRPARLRVQWATTESFRDPRTVIGPVASAETGFTAKVDLSDLPDDQRVFLRVRFEDVADGRSLSVPVEGSFLSAPSRRRDVTFAWSADVAGQGWGIDRDRGGMRMFDTIRRAQPDFFIHCGDTIYADAPIPPELPLPDGSTWRNVVTPAKSTVAQTLDEFRGNYAYNLLDGNVRQFNAAVPQIVLWDDHEFRDNWYPGRSLADDDRYTLKDPAVLMRNARQAFLEHMPVRLVSRGAPIYRSCAYGPLVEVFALDLRSLRGPNAADQGGGRTVADAGSLAGAEQIGWLKQALARSTAMWKVIASDVPLALVVRDGDRGFDSFGNGSGAPRGREHELADLLRFIRERRICNIIWVTADVHYAAAHHYDPLRARFTEFDPFWEFVAGPMHAATGVPLPLDDTFGPEVRFQQASPDGQPWVGPAAGRQYYGLVRISGQTGVMTVTLRDVSDTILYSVELPPEL